MFVKRATSYTLHVFITRPEIPSGPAALRVLTFTFSTETVNNASMFSSSGRDRSYERGWFRFIVHQCLNSLPHLVPVLCGVKLRINFPAEFTFCGDDGLPVVVPALLYVTGLKRERAIPDFIPDLIHGFWLGKVRTALVGTQSLTQCLMKSRSEGEFLNMFQSTVGPDCPAVSPPPRASSAAPAPRTSTSKSDLTGQCVTRSPTW